MRRPATRNRQATNLDPAVWKKLRESIGACDRVAIFSDFDGTLAPIVSEPEEARLDEETRRILKRLVRSTRTRLAVISGRTLVDLARRVAVNGVYLAGSHGIEVMGPMFSFVHPLAVQRVEIKREMARSLRSGFSGVPGVVIEEKPYSIACHYRGAPRPRAGSIFRRVREALPAAFLEWRILRGHEVIEILPVRGWTKGSCARLLLDHYAAMEPAWSRGIPIAIGDDASDQDLFRAIRPRGICIAVGGSARLRAEHRLDDHAQVRSFLDLLHGEMRDRGSTDRDPIPGEE
jgi:trehalose-phosphatase